MKLFDVLGIALALVLGTLVSVYAARVADAHPDARVELARTKLTRVDDATRARLQALEEDVLVTYYVSPRAEMPSEFKRLERQVTELLDALEEASNGRFRYQILDPHESEEDAAPEDGQARPETSNARYAARQGIAPFRVRSITRDAWSEETIWSTMTMAYGAYPPAVINGVRPETLPRIVPTLFAHIDQARDPRRPRVALVAPEARGGSTGFELLAAELADEAEVVRGTFGPGDALSLDSDVLFWMDPGPVDAGMLVQLERYLASGRSVVVAGSLYSASVGRSPSGAFDPGLFEVQRSDFDAETLWSHFGLRPTPGLLCDTRSVVHVAGEGEARVETPLPFLVRCIAPNQRFGMSFRGQPNGTLMFGAATPLALEPETLADRGWTPSVLAHTSDGTWIEAVPSGLADARELSPERGVETSRQPLVTLLEPTDPWRGSVVAMGSATPLRDDLLAAEGFAHRRLVDVLVRNLASDARLVLLRAEMPEPDPVPELSGAERTLWRAVCVFGLPAVLLLVGLLRGTFRSGRVGSRITGLSRSPVALPLVLALAVGVVVARAADGLAVRGDLTANGINGLAPTTRELAERATGSRAISADLWFSPPERMPPDLREAASSVTDLLSDLERAGAEVDVTDHDPTDVETLPPGVRSVRMVSRVDGVTTVRNVHTTLVLSSGERREVLSFEDAAAFEDLEFRVAFALWRLETGERPHVAFASDTPRLSPAEAHMDYQLKGLFAPIGEDVYSLARERLEDAGFRVTHVNPRAPEFPSDFDALVWLQPRRDVTVMLDAVTRYLNQGMPVLLAAQHFNMQARQYRGTNFKIVYWPQPQTPDLDIHWMPELGIELVREVLFDELKTRRSLETQVNRNASVRDYEDQESARPFQIRASAANFADHPLVRGLGDQSFVWANRIRWDDERLAELGIEATPLITTSARTWSYAWRGGYLPDEVYTARPDEEREVGQGTAAAVLTPLGREPLAVLFEGVFPLPSEPLVDPPEEGRADLRVAVPEAPAAASELVLVGASEPFKNPSIADPEFRADQLLVNLVAGLALEPELASVATRRRTTAGLDYVPAETRQRWRGIVVAAFPAAMLAFGLVRRLWRNRAPRAGRSAA